MASQTGSPASSLQLAATLRETAARLVPALRRQHGPRDRQHVVLHHGDFVHYATPRRGSAFIDHYPPLGRFPPPARDAPGGNVHGHGVAPLPRDPQALRHHAARGGGEASLPRRARRALPETVRGERAEQPPFTGLACQQASCRTPFGCGASSAWSVPPTPRSCPPRATAPRQCITWTRRKT